jgi:hypothetical protein
MRRTLVVIAFAASIATLGACSGEPEGQTPSGVGESFAARAIAVCRTALESKQAWSVFPAADFDPNQPDPSAFPEVGAWLEDDVAPTFEAWLDGLTALGTPPSGQESWGEVLADVDTIVGLNADQVAAAKSDDVDGFVEAKDGLAAIQPELERATAAAGVATCADVHKG